MQVFPIAPATTRPLLVLLPVAAIMLVALVVLTVSLLGARTSRFEVSASGLRLRGDLYGRLVPAAHLRTELARRVNLEHEAELRPRWRTLGTGLAGYQAGWFRLRNREKALVYLTDRSRAVHVPTTEGYVLLLSPGDPDGFLAALRGMER